MISENKLFRERLRDELTGIAEFILVSAGEMIKSFLLSCASFHFVWRSHKRESATCYFVTFHNPRQQIAKLHFLKINFFVKGYVTS